MTKPTTAEADYPKMTEADEPTITINTTQAAGLTFTGAAIVSDADPAQTGITHLRTIDPGAMRLWSVRGPKGTDSTISGVLVEDGGFNTNPAILIMHQFANGKFTLFEKVAL